MGGQRDKAVQENVNKCAQSQAIKPISTKSAYRPTARVAEVNANFSLDMIKNTVSVSVNCNKTNALCDTGANMSCVSKSFLDKAFTHNKPKFIPSIYTSIKGVGGTIHPVSGSVSLEVKFKRVSLVHDFLVVEDLHHSLILGHDFLDKYMCIVDIPAKKLRIADIVVCSIRTDRGYARTIKPVCIEANSEVVLPVKVARVCSDTDVLLDPSPNLANYNILGAKSLVTVRKGKAQLRLVNPTKQNITLKGNKVLALVSKVSSENVFSLEQDNNQACENIAQPSSKNSSKMPTSTDPNLNFDLTDTNLDSKQKDLLLGVLKKNIDVFSKGPYDLGKTNLQIHDIDTGDSKPVRTPFYKQTPHMRRKQEEMVSDMIDKGILKESNSDWHSPVVLVKKSDTNETGEYRFAVDYRKLNKITKPIAYPLPRLSDMLDAIGEANPQFFTSLDLGKAFWQVPLSDSSKQKAAIITQNGIFEFQTMPFGLSGAPATFQSLMMKVLKGVAWKYALCYVDDVIIFSRNFEEHLKHIDEILNRIKNAGLKLSPNKCKFAQQKLHYLGHILSRNGIETDERKVEKIQNLVPPKDQKGVKSLLGLTNYYKKFILGYSKICSPLFELLKKDKPFIWTGECQAALDKLKTALTTAPILAFPDMEKPFILTCDASRSGLGYILGQLDHEGKERVIEYNGRSLQAAEKNYSATELECLAIVQGIKTFKAYLSTGRKFTIVTDHKALKTLNTLNTSTNDRIARWHMLLTGYRYEVVYRKGENNNADILSRIPENIGENGKDKAIESISSNSRVTLMK